MGLSLLHLHEEVAESLCRQTWGAGLEHVARAAFRVADAPRLLLKQCAGCAAQARSRRTRCSTP